MAWILLLIAGMLEVVWAYSMKLSEGFTRLTPSVMTIVMMIASFGLLSIAMRTLPLARPTPSGPASAPSAPSSSASSFWASKSTPCACAPPSSSCAASY